MRRAIIAAAILLAGCVSVAPLSTSYLTVQLPEGCAPVLSGSTVTCSGTPPPVVEVCPPGTTGTPPNCVPIPPPTASCEGFAHAIHLTMDWNNPQPLMTGAMGPLDIAVVKFTTGPATNPAGYGNITGAAVCRAAVGAQRRAIGSGLQLRAPLNAGAQSISNTTTVNFSVGQNTSGYYPSLLPNTVYYFNVQNQKGSTCAHDGVCSMYFQLHRPPGT